MGEQFPHIINSTEKDDMQILNTLNKKELAQTILAEVAKAKNEIRCAESDLKKANSRLGFLVAVANELLNKED